MPQFVIMFEVVGPHCGSCTGNIKYFLEEDDDRDSIKKVRRVKCSTPFNNSCVVTLLLDCEESQIPRVVDSAKTFIKGIDAKFKPKEGYVFPGRVIEKAPEPINFPKRVAEAGLSLVSGFIYTYVKFFAEGWQHDASKKLVTPLLALFLMYLTGRKYFEIPFRQRLGMNTLITLSSGIAWLFSSLIMWSYDSWQLSEILFFNSPFFTFATMNLSTLLKDFINREIELKSVGNKNALVEAQPQRVYYKAPGEAKVSDEERSYFSMEKDSEFTVRLNQRVPVDCEILDGKVTVNESIITGETSVEKMRGNTVYAGSQVLTSGGSVRFKASVHGGDSRLNDMYSDFAFPKEGDKRFALQALVHTISRNFFVALLTAAVTTALAWSLSGHDVTTVVRALMNVMFGACVCALALSIPTVLSITQGLAFKHHIQIKDENVLGVRILGVLGFFESLIHRVSCFKRVKYMVFDNTGTLTDAKSIAMRQVTAAFSDKQIWGMVGRLEAAFIASGKDHPIARALVAEANLHGHVESEGLEVKIDESSKGCGVSGQVGHHRITIGSYAYLKEQRLYLGEALPSDVMIHIDGVFRGSLTMNSALRPGALKLVNFLKQNGIKPVIMTGGHCADFAKNVLGIEDVRTNLKPEDKQQQIAELQAEGGVAFVGDGGNDGPAAQQADVSFAVASDAALSSLKVGVILNGSLEDLIGFLKLSNAASWNIKQNLGFSLLYNLTAVLVGAMHPDIQPFAFGIAMGVSSLLVVANATRLYRGGFWDQPVAVPVTSSSALLPRPSRV